MNPTIVEGDRVLVNKIAFGLRVPFTTLHVTDGDAPKRGDIVVFDSPVTGVTLIKRVIGLPGDVLEMNDEQLYLNHRPVSYAKLQSGYDHDFLAAAKNEKHFALDETLPGHPHAIMILPMRGAMRNFGPIVVPANSYFMMGDNRDNSEDSRFIGTIARDAIVGRASRVVVSLDPEHAYLPRSDRTLLPLQ
jgi:signal peptidase I